MGNEFRVKNGLIINSTQTITGITNSSNFSSGDTYTLATVNAITGYLGNKRVNTYVSYNSGGTLSGSSSLTFNGNTLNVSGDTKNSYGLYSYNGAMCVKMINKTGGTTTKGKLVTYNSNYNIPFTIGTGFNNPVGLVEIQSDNKILAGGNFTSYSGISSSYFIRLNYNGTKDTTFNSGSGFNNSVNTINILPDDKMILGGSFTLYSGVTYNRIVKLYKDGFIDTGFTIGTGFSNTVISVCIQSDNKIIVGGNFTSYSGITQNYITRLNTDGTRDTGFTIGTGFNTYTWGSNSIAIQPDGKIIIVGWFTQYNSVTQNYITRLNVDGTRDTGFTIGTGFNNTATCVKLQSTGKIIVGGAYTQYNGATQNYITRLNVDGTRDTGFTIGSGFNSGVYSIDIQSDDKILVGGDFTTYNGSTCYHIVRLNANGSIDTGFTSAGTGLNNTVYDICIQPDGKVLVGGTFITYNGVTQNRIARLQSNGTLDNVSTYVANAFKYYPSGTTLSDAHIGVTVESGIVDGSSTYIALYGVCDVKLASNSNSVHINTPLSTYNSLNDGDICDGSTTTNIGHALQDGVAGDTIKCLLYNKDKQ